MKKTPTLAFQQLCGLYLCVGNTEESSPEGPLPLIISSLFPFPLGALLPLLAEGKVSIPSLFSSPLFKPWAFTVNYLMYW